MTGSKGEERTRLAKRIVEAGTHGFIICFPCCALCFKFSVIKSFCFFLRKVKTFLQRELLATFKSPSQPLGTRANLETREGGDFDAFENCPS